MCFLKMSLHSLLVQASIALLLFTSTTAGVTVYEDINANGQQDPGEPGIQGVSVVDPITVFTLVTDANGSWTGAGTSMSYEYDYMTMPSGLLGLLQTESSDPALIGTLWTSTNPPAGTTNDGYCFLNAPTDCCAFSKKKVRIFKFLNGSSDPMIGTASIDLMWTSTPYVAPIGTRVMVQGVSGSWWFLKIASPISVGFSGIKGSNQNYFVKTPDINPKDWYVRGCATYKVVIVFNLDTGATNTRFTGNCASGTLFGATSFLCWEMLVRAT